MNRFTLVDRVEINSCMRCPYVNESAQECTISGAKLEHPFWIPDSCVIIDCTIDLT